MVTTRSARTTILYAGLQLGGPLDRAPAAAGADFRGVGMKGAYRVFGYLIAAEVVIQAAAIALAVFGLGKWIEDGGTLTKSVMENDDTSINGVIGFAIHGINGTMIIPILGLLFLIISFFAKVPGGIKWASITFGLIVLQVLLGMFAHEVYALGV